MLVLEEIYRTKKNEFSAAFNLRMQRSLSWWKKAIVLHDDLDLQFMSTWVALNALYAQGKTAEQEQQTLQQFAFRVYQKDVDQRISRILWEKHPQSLEVLLTNPYLCQSFWDWRNQKISEGTWRTDFESEKQHIMQALHTHDSASILSFVFKRLSTLHQQLVQGGATYNSAINRKQLSHASLLLSALLPCFIQILLENVESLEWNEWSQPFYPVMQMS